MKRLFVHREELDSVPSTNDHLKNFVREGIPRMAVAWEQTAGKGRFGREWHSPRGRGLYVSYLLFPQWQISLVSSLNHVAVLAVHDAIEELPGAKRPLRLKSPNDVFLGHKKVAGVLVELSSLGRRISWAIIGIGVNLGQKHFPPPLQGRATSLLSEGVAGIDRDRFCERLTHHLEHSLGLLEEGRSELLEVRFRRLTGQE